MLNAVLELSTNVLIPSQVMLNPVKVSFVGLGVLQLSRSVEVSIEVKLTSDGGGRNSTVKTVSI